MHEIDLKKELAKGYRMEMLESNFPYNSTYRAFAQASPIYTKEMIMAEINTDGLNALAKYDPILSGEVAGNDIKIALLDVAIQLIRDAHNEHTNGSGWDYWFSFPKGYHIQNHNDSRLDAAELLLHKLRSIETDSKNRAFMAELLGYINIVQDKPVLARGYYKQAADAVESYPVSNNRAVKMLAVIGREFQNH